MTYGTMDKSPTTRPSIVNSRSRRRLGGSFSQRPILKTTKSKKQFREPALGKALQRKPKSFVYTMLNPRSIEWQAVAFKWFITTVITLDLFAFIMSTDSDLNKSHANIYAVWEEVDSWIFLAEYVLRLITVTESVKYGSMGPIAGRLRYMMTTSALVDLVATLPYFLEQFSGYDLPTLTYLRSFRLLRILKTQGFTEAIKSVCRVFRYNSEILYVALWIGIGLVMCTAVMMYYLRPRGNEHVQFKSLPATIYLATMILTGQGGPDGELPWYTSSVVVLTGVFSIGMFAIPASMLTWGFEGEAERLAKLRWKRATVVGKTENQKAEDEMNDDWSYSSDDYSTDEEYLNVIAGLDDDDSDDEDTIPNRAFQLADINGSKDTSHAAEFMKHSRDAVSNMAALLEGESFKNSSITPKRLEALENKVEENSKKLDRICEILEGMQFSEP